MKNSIEFPKVIYLVFMMLWLMLPWTINNNTNKMELIYTISHKHIEDETKWTPFRRRHFQMYFLEFKYMNSDKKFTYIYSLRSIQQYSSFGLDNGLAPSRRQAIIWTNDGLLYLCIYAYLGHNELICKWFFYALAILRFDLTRLTVLIEFDYIIHGCFTGTRAIIWFLHVPWNNQSGMGVTK